MFGGKTEELLRRLRARAGANVRAFKHTRDNRYSDRDIVSHGQDHSPATVVTRAAEILDHVDGTEDLIGIDEGHFYDSKLAAVCDKLADRGIDVLVTALDPDSWGRTFPTIEQLKQTADTVTTITTICARCGEPADRTQRVTPITDGNIIGGPEAFEPRCATCWHPPPEPHIR
jgi:thymidine kinase